MRLGRGIGMGGTASVMLWNAAYDPIIYATEAAAGAACPTYVDDTACLVDSPRGAMRAMVALIVASHVAGLRPDSHTCGWLRVQGDADAADRLRNALAPFPSYCHCERGEGVLGSWARRPLYARPGRSTPPGCHHPRGAHDVRLPGEVRHPAGAARGSLGRSLQHGPLRRSPVPFAKYLGVWPAARQRRGVVPRSLWCPEVLRALASLTWDRVMVRLRERAAEIGRGSGSPGFSSLLWDTYAVTLVPYPAHYILPQGPYPTGLADAFRTAFHLGTWAPWWMVVGLAPHSAPAPAPVAPCPLPAPPARSPGGAARGGALA